MQGNDPFSYHFKKSQVKTIKSAEASMITLERSQKLDLLIHLISNLRQSLVLCGPHGIGKTTVLNELKDRKQDVWLMMSILATSDLSFESIQNQLKCFCIQQNDKFKNQDLTTILSDNGNQKIVLIIDDAGMLVPGLVTSLMQYASAHSCLRVIFSLTHDELHLKNSSDQIINECHFIEIPPLTEKQCGIFLQNLSAQPKAVVAFSSISDRLIENVYKQTHGIPGKIISELPRLSNYRATNNYKSGGVVLAVIILGVVINYFGFDSTVTKTEKKDAPVTLVLQEAGKVDISSPVIRATDENESLPVLDNKNNYLPKLELPVADQSEFPGKGNIVKTEISSELDEPVEVIDVERVVPKIEIDEPLPVNVVNEEIVVKKFDEPLENTSQEIVTIDFKEPLKKGVVEKEIVKPKKTAEIDIKEIDDRQWLMAQPATNYTIQLIVLSELKSVKTFIKKNLGLQKELKFFQVVKNGIKSYTLIYGSFSSAKLASNKMKSLPVKYRKSWVRRFKNLQKL